MVFDQWCRFFNQKRLSSVALVHAMVLVTAALLGRSRCQTPTLPLSGRKKNLQNFPTLRPEEKSADFPLSHSPPVSKMLDHSPGGLHSRNFYFYQVRLDFSDYVFDCFPPHPGVTWESSLDTESLTQADVDHFQVSIRFSSLPSGPRVYCTAQNVPDPLYTQTHLDTCAISAMSLCGTVLICV